MDYLPTFPSHRRPATPRLGRFWYGVCYYPEQWDEATRRDDAARMAAAGINLVRLAEFAWDRLEPAENQFDFTLFDEVIATLGRHGIATMLGTPTAAPPRWLTAKHPEIRRVDANGRTLPHGSRQHACTTNPLFRHHSRRITQAMARHFQANPLVVGWQTDNEFHCHFSECHCPACQAGFQEFLRHQYHDIQTLNQAWGNAFWSQSLNGFADLTTPRPDQPAAANPAARLDYARFLSAATSQFQHEQVEILRQANPAWWITHNGLFANLDYRGEFGRELDVLGYDCYPMFCHDPELRPRVQAWNLDRARAWTGNFIVPEQQAGPGGQPPYLLDTPEPGEMRKMAYSSIARGADSLLFFRWRTCRFGAEQFWCGLLDHDNVPRRRYAEAAQLGRELQAVGPQLRDTSVFVDAAIASSDLAVATVHANYSLGLPSPDDAGFEMHRALFDLGYAVGAIHPSDDLSGVKLYVMPHGTVVDPEWVANLRTFVEDGGVLVIGARCGTHDCNGNVVGQPLPGLLASLAGVTVEEFGRQNRPDLRPLALDFSGTGEKESLVATSLWYEELKPLAPTVETLATWSGRHLHGKPAITLNRVGDGTVLYVGTWLTHAVVQALVAKLVLLAGLRKPWLSAPLGVEVVRRERDGHRVWFFINHANRARVLPSTPPGTELISGRHTDGGEWPLPLHGVAVIAEEIRT